MFENLTHNGRTATEKGGIAILDQDKEKSQIFQQESAPKSVNFFKTAPAQSDVRFFGGTRDTFRKHNQRLCLRRCFLSQRGTKSVLSVQSGPAFWPQKQCVGPFRRLLTVT